MDPVNDKVSFFFSFYQFADSLQSIEKRCSFYDMIFRYAFFAEIPNKDDNFLYSIFLLIKPNIDANIKFSLSAKKSNKKNKDMDKEKNKDMDGDMDKEEGQNSPLNSPLKTYPQSVEDVISIAQDNCIMITEEEAEKYFLNRDSADWHNANGNRIRISGIVSDIKQWVLRSKQYKQNNCDDGDNDLSQSSKSMLD